MNRKRILYLILVFVLLLSLTACGSKSEENSDHTSELEQPVILSDEGQWIGKGGCYALDRITENEYYVMKGNKDHLIFSNYEHLFNEDGNILIDGFIHDYEVTEDGIWCALEKGMVGDEYIQDCYIIQLDFDGKEIKRLDLSTRADSLAVVSDDLYIFDSMDKELTVYSTDGSKRGSVNLDNANLEDFSGNLYVGGDGNVWLLNRLETGISIYPVNLSTMNLGSGCSLPENSEGLYTGTKEQNFLLSTQKEFDYFDTDSGKTSNILYWDECGISNGELNSFIPDGDGFLCLSVTGLSRLRPAQSEEIHPKTQLTIGTIFKYDGSDQLAASFNAISDDYYVKVIDYSNDGEMSREDAMKKLNTELMGGDGTDMIMISDMEYLQNASVFADIYPLLDKDTELDRDDFYGLNAMETGGKLLLAPSKLMVSTFYGLKKVVGDRTGWTWDEYFEEENKLPPNGVMSSYLSADFFLQSSLDLYAPHAIDWVNGTCDFDTPEFIRILDAAKKGYDPNCPVENQYNIDEVNSMIADGSMILDSTCFFDTQSFAQSENLCGGEVSYIGWPTPDGSCGSVFNVSGVSIYAGTDNLDGSWEFAKYVMKNTYAYKPTFEKAMEEARTANETDSGEEDIALNQDQIDCYRELMENINVAVTDNSEISDIVLEEASGLFAGYKTPEETAKLIQSRLSIYVAEHKN